MTDEHPLSEVKVWDRSIRVFHWVNVLCVIALMIIGSAILYASALGISSDGKITLKIMHAYIGYVFACNLIWRLIWGFVGSRFASWRAVVPFGPGYVGELKTWWQNLRSGQAPTNPGHNPVAKLMLLALYTLLIGQMCTGLVLAGTDLYFPPFGHEFAEWATGAGEDHSRLVGLVPGAKEMLDPEGYAAMRTFREPFIALHKLFFWFTLGAGFLHIAAVIIDEIRHGNGIVSAMITGKKIIRRNVPGDANEE